MSALPRNEDDTWKPPRGVYRGRGVVVSGDDEHMGARVLVAGDCMGGVVLTFGSLVCISRALLVLELY